MAAPSMNQVAERFAGEEIGSVFLYTNEAHPGENYLHLTSMEQKFSHADALAERLGVDRPIYLDALDGACHRAFGSMPNMTWIFSRTGSPVYKSDWSDAHSVANTLQYLLEVRQRRRAGERMAPFKVERLDYRDHDRQHFFEGLERSGPRAVEEFKRAFPNDRPKQS
jgi:hypothetical protein